MLAQRSQPKVVDILRARRNLTIKTDMENWDEKGADYDAKPPTASARMGRKGESRRS